MNLLRDTSTRQVRRDFLSKRMYSGSADGYLPAMYKQAAETKFEIL